ncbi:hypothetical protein DTO013E5_7400 [Penicillium roqueforti]|uniref:Genomic scaffold, ProqFM164S03 n=1 Tax=Penicillium roqueforti (strain FM164) TaxID=1365484 RepID=W6QAQ6_PENRF|nr:uncharacterized protein LCP9604111_5105 [Penicillium roqueforti]CDM33545.1 unnamed protein product [Penicillium roqueforti FM164]KAF9248866.1 hypothetical protein LCP9604111_5105 [Penicillium roqueforti]KAI1831744.1 hypothetical protein CBS147337_7554 [Penicillium roqueforti]KAI2681577.1 hypothetical protein CBS147355_2787 [Penicillium roqueforti]KAI2688965.1 hypothetical protein LCP963914a_2054 [Penicillium roqueforti]
MVLFESFVWPLTTYLFECFSSKKNSSTSSVKSPIEQSRTTHIKRFINMSSLQCHLDITNEPGSEDETGESVTSEGQVEQEATHLRPWNGFWPRPLTVLKPGGIIPIQGN